MGVELPAGEELGSVKLLGGSSEQNRAPRSPVHSNTGLEYKPGLLVAKATVKGFDKPWSILFDSGASGNYVRRYYPEGNTRYVGELKAHKGDAITVRLATGTLVNAPKVPVSLGVKFFDFNSTELCLVLNLDSRYDLD